MMRLHAMEEEKNCKKKQTTINIAPFFKDHLVWGDREFNVTQHVLLDMLILARVRFTISDLRDFK